MGWADVMQLSESYTCMHGVTQARDSELYKLYILEFLIPKINDSCVVADLLFMYNEFNKGPMDCLLPGAGFPSVPVMYPTQTVIQLLNLEVSGGPYLEVGDSLISPVATWLSSGLTGGAVLQDDVGVMQPTPSTVTSPYTIPNTYTYVTPTTVTWSVYSSPTVQSTYSISWVNPSFNGKKLTSGPPTSSEIALGTKTIIGLEDNLLTYPNNTPVEYVWFAVPKDSSYYQYWFSDPGNMGVIGPNEFIIQGADVTVNGILYEVYYSSYPSSISNSFILY